MVLIHGKSSRVPVNKGIPGDLEIFTNIQSERLNVINK